jgi:predicted transcriptional regulator
MSTVKALIDQAVDLLADPGLVAKAKQEFKGGRC